MIENLNQFATKKFGQNFLKDDKYVLKIIQAIPKNNLPIIEIGPGLGDLTKELVKVKQVTAFEVDKRLCEYLKEEFYSKIENRTLELNCGDVLEHWKFGTLKNEKYNLVANLPYYIATNIILKALHDENCNTILVMVQKEVALKFSALVKERAFCSLSVLTQTVGEAKICFEVEPQAFIPPPKVTSAVLLIKKRISLQDSKFEDFLRVAFKQPRKKLSKNLIQVFPKLKVINTLEKLDISSNLRPHEVETLEYHHIYNELKDNLDGRENSSSKRE